jgi:mono/diheme cytochrome c family protein
MKQIKLLAILSFGVLLFFSSCTKTVVAPDTVYVPTVSDVTATATLAQLQQGHSLFVGRCGSCHGLPSPDAYSASNWTSILANMAPRAGLSSAETALVSKYVNRGR